MLFSGRIRVRLELVSGWLVELSGYAHVFILYIHCTVPWRRPHVGISPNVLLPLTESGQF